MTSISIEVKLMTDEKRLIWSTRSFRNGLSACAATSQVLVRDVRDKNALKTLNL